MKKIFKGFILLLFGMMLSFNAMAKQYAVIVNNANHFNGDPKNYYLLKQGFGNWPNGVAVIPYDLKTSDLKKVIVRVAFIKNVLGMGSAGDLDKHWIQQKSKGITRKAEQKNDFASILKFVKREKGGVGFVPAELAKGVKVIKTFEVK